MHTVTEGNNGCNGGDMFNSFMYIIFNDGIDTARSYSYVGKVRLSVYSYAIVI